MLPELTYSVMHKV